MDPHLQHDLGLHSAHKRRLAQAVMRRQAALSLKVAAVFLAILFGLPLFNYFAPELANTPVLGFTFTWLFLGVLFYPVTWLLSWLFIRQSNRIEEEILASIHHGALHDEAEAAGATGHAGVTPAGSATATPPPAPSREEKP